MCFPASHWEDAALFEAVYQLLTYNFIISARKALGIDDIFTFLNFVVCFNLLEA